MGEHKRRQGQKDGRAPLRAIAGGKQGAPEATLRLVVTASEVGLASYLCDFAATMGISRYRSQTAAIAYVAKVPHGRLVGQVVQVCQVPDGFAIVERFSDPRTTPPPLPDLAEVEALSLAAAAALGAPDPEAARELLVRVADVDLGEAAEG
jgi:hypothetical protein